jgi:cytochrome c oxidase cbb3-type subunit 3
VDSRTPDGQQKVVDVGTTGHSWDGITELNTPLPRWWLWLFYATIVWSVGYWVVYPSWPLVSSYARGVSGWHAREGVVQDLAALKAQRAKMTELLAATPIEDVAKNAELMAFARAQGKAAFGDNCTPCHGAGGGGAKGFPNLNDDDWLWGGKLHEIATTLQHGVRWTLDENTRNSAMPAFGRDNILNATQMSQVADYVRSLSDLPVDNFAILLAGAKIFEEI